jgi:penicillin-binding protein 2
VTDSFSKRQYTIRIIMVIAAVVLAGKAFYLQVIDPEYSRKANATAMDEYTIYPARGTIYDRNDSLLVYNVPMYDLMVTANQVSEDMDTAAFCELLGIDRDYFEEAMDKDWSDPRYSTSVPFPFMTNISAKDFAALEERLYEFSGFSKRLRHARGYPHSNAPHALGYIREVDKRDIARGDGTYAPRDYIGKSGLELAYEDMLRGKKGTSVVLKDNLGREVGPYKGGDLDELPITGQDMIATLDLELQQYGEQLMQNKMGSIVAIEPSSGEVLAMVSSPAYDPNLLAINRKRGNPYGKLSMDETKPLFDRSIMAQYPPGSLFKPIVALIGLQTGELQPNRSITCRGAYYLNGMRLTGCHSHPTSRNVESAIQHSCNAYFVTVFREIVDGPGTFRNPEKGLDIFNSYLSQMGLGSKLGIDLPREKGGFYPTSQFYTDYFNRQQEGQRWNSVWIRSLGIGQGELLMTNLQLANLAAIIANRGTYRIPHLVKAFKGDKAIPIPKKYREVRKVDIDKKHFDLVANGMEKVVEAGTARMSRIPGISFCGKTGTAENPHGKDHSIFFAFAPKEDPKIAIAVYVENAGYGSTFAAPIASLVTEKFLNDTISNSRKWLEARMMNADLMEKEEDLP